MSTPKIPAGTYTLPQLLVQVVQQEDPASLFFSTIKNDAFISFLIDASSASLKQKGAAEAKENSERELVNFRFNSDQNLLEIEHQKTSGSAVTVSLKLQRDEHGLDDNEKDQLCAALTAFSSYCKSDVKLTVGNDGQISVPKKARSPSPKPFINRSVDSRLTLFNSCSNKIAISGLLGGTASSLLLGSSVYGYFAGLGLLGGLFAAIPPLAFLVSAIVLAVLTITLFAIMTQSMNQSWPKGAGVGVLFSLSAASFGAYLAGVASIAGLAIPPVALLIVGLASTVVAAASLALIFRPRNYNPLLNDKVADRDADGDADGCFSQLKASFSR